MSNQEDDKDKIDSVDSREIVSQESEVNKKKNKPEELKSEADLVFDDLPEEAQAVMKMVLSSRSISTSPSPLSNPLSDKINKEHISKMLDIAEKDNEREFEDTKLSKQYNLITLIIIAFLKLVRYKIRSQSLYGVRV